MLRSFALFGLGLHFRVSLALKSEVCPLGLGLSFRVRFSLLGLGVPSPCSADAAVELPRDSRKEPLGKSEIL